ncbi:MULTISPECIES: hypothetical protein [unclassified Marinitoga]|uniref:hypothetical protein n=1 Tax=unclassified Marinitoga TaxID=2640159 RepID=UPI0006410C9E|nr:MULTISPECIES: hypothetical protein [unclassified Marinitoga]KLO24932.1 hypothetical protein X274_01430 [Marinitoga sp. 1155]NUU99016.1 hypothetical protein [Marinitoga sp. 1154]
MILLNPLIVLVGMIMYIIPYLWPLSFAITMFVYHILLKNRDEHIKRIKILFKTEDLEFFNLKQNNSLKILFGYIISFSGFTIIFIKISNQLERFYSNISSVEELKNIEFVLPTFDTFLFFLFLFFIWFTYIKLINRIIKDQFYLQNIEIQKNLIKEPILKYRDANFIMFLRLITFNLYEWFLLISLLKETNSLYKADGTYEINLEKMKKEIKQDVSDPFENIKQENFNSKEEFLSYLYSEISKLNVQNRLKILEKLLEKNILSKEDAEKIKKLF